MRACRVRVRACGCILSRSGLDPRRRSSRSPLFFSFCRRPPFFPPDQTRSLLSLRPLARPLDSGETLSLGRRSVRQAHARRRRRRKGPKRDDIAHPLDVIDTGSVILVPPSFSTPNTPHPRPPSSPPPSSPPLSGQYREGTRRSPTTDADPSAQPKAGLCSRSRGEIDREFRRAYLIRTRVSAPVCISPAAVC